MSIATGVARLLRPALIDRVERDHHESDQAFRRRRVVVVVVLAIGITLLGLSLTSKPGGTAFYWLSIALAATWIIGGFLSGPLHLGRTPFRGQLRRPLITPIALGLAAGAVFVLGALILREIPPLRDYVQHVLAFARRGSLPVVVAVTLLNGLAEEVFFRGALFAAIGRKYPVVLSTVIYAIATIASGNPVLVFAAVVLGVLLGLERRASGGILGPILTHVVWSSIVVLGLPPLFNSR